MNEWTLWLCHDNDEVNGLVKHPDNDNFNGNDDPFWKRLIVIVFIAMAWGKIHTAIN